MQFSTIFLAAFAAMTVTALPHNDWFNKHEIKSEHGFGKDFGKDFKDFKDFGKDYKDFGKDFVKDFGKHFGKGNSDFGHSQGKSDFGHSHGKGKGKGKNFDPEPPVYATQSVKHQPWKRAMPTAAAEPVLMA